MRTPCTGHAAESERDEYMAEAERLMDGYGDAVSDVVGFAANPIAFLAHTDSARAALLDHIRRGVVPDGHIAVPRFLVENHRSVTEVPRYKRMLDALIFSAYVPDQFRDATEMVPASENMSELEARILRDYTHKQPCFVDGFPDAHTAWLRVGVQSFCVTPNCCDTADEAEWTRAMLAKALAHLVRMTTAPSPAPAEVPTAENRAELLAEDIECLHMVLDDQGIPRYEGDETLSMWGRCMRYGDAREAAGYARGVAQERERCAQSVQRGQTP